MVEDKRQFDCQSTFEKDKANLSAIDRKINKFH